MPRREAGPVPVREIIAAAAAVTAIIVVIMTRQHTQVADQRAVATPSPAPEQNTPDRPPVSFRRSFLLRLLPLLVVIAAAAWATAALQVSDWMRWTLGGITAAGSCCLLIALLLGPVACRLAGESRPLTAAERSQMTAHERIEAVNNARHIIIQAI